MKLDFREATPSPEDRAPNTRSPGRALRRVAPTRILSPYMFTADTFTRGRACLEGCCGRKFDETGTYPRSRLDTIVSRWNLRVRLSS